MKTEPAFPPGYLDSLARACFGTAETIPFGRTAAAQLAGAAFGTALFTGALAVHLAWYGGRALLTRLRRRVAPPESLPPLAPQAPVSLRGVPSPEDIEDIWDLDPRTLCGRLRIGSRLADLEPTLDARFV